MPDVSSRKIGLIGKFHVSRVDGRDADGGDRSDAQYFVLDYVHDPMARTVLVAYIELARARGFYPLAADLERQLELTHPTFHASQARKRDAAGLCILCGKPRTEQGCEGGCSGV